MSRLALLTATASGADGVPGEPPPDPPPDAPQLTYPPTIDAVLSALRPHGRQLAAYSVDDRFPVTSTNKHDVGVALTAASDARTAYGQGVSGAWNVFPGVDSGPDYRMDVIQAVDGVGFGTGGWSNVVGATGDPDDVVMTTADDSDGVVHTFGSIYMEGLTLKAVSPDGMVSPKYPWHITGGEVMIAAHCNFDISEAVFAGVGTTSGTVGMDGAPGAFVVFYRCKFVAPPGAPTMNLHGSTPGADPITVCFIECDVTDIGQVGFDGPGDVDDNPDKLYVVGCTGLTEITGPATVHVYTDSDCAVTGGAAVTRDFTAWPAPANGLDAVWNAYYGDNFIEAPATITYGLGDAANFTPPAGRSYLVPAPVPDGIHVTHVGIVAAAAGGTYGILPRRVNVPYEDIDDVAETGVGIPVLNGAQDVIYYYFFTWYPGQSDRLFVEVGFDGTASVKGSLVNAAGAYYNDGAGWLAVPGGTRVPVVSIRSAS